MGKKTARQMSAAERQKVKDELGKWKEQKEKQRLADVNVRNEAEERL